jgi:hypothetical protein
MFNADLIEDLAIKRVVLFIGSGVSASGVTRCGSRIRQWHSFLDYASSQLGDEERHQLVKSYLKEKNYLFAAEVIKNSLSNTDWAQLIQDEFGQIADPSDLHRAIVSLDQRIIVTTNFDKLLENAWADPLVRVTHFPQVITRLDTSAFKILRESGSYLVKLHGTVDDPESIVFTQSDYTKHAYINWAYSSFIETLLTTYTVLFIGFSMNDPALSRLVEMHAQRYPLCRPHYIFTAAPMHDTVKEINRSLRRLYVMEYSSENHHSELIDHIRELGRQSQAKRRENVASTSKEISEPLINPMVEAESAPLSPSNNDEQPLGSIL